MDQSQLHEQLVALASAGPRRISKIDRLRSEFPLIENALHAGASRHDVLKLLNNAGYELTLICFKSYLQRIRREAREEMARQQRHGAEATESTVDPRGCSLHPEESHRMREVGTTCPPPTQIRSELRLSMGEFLVPKTSAPSM